MLTFLCSYVRRGESHWWMKGSTPTQISEIIIKLIKDMAAVSSHPPDHYVIEVQSKSD